MKLARSSAATRTRYRSSKLSTELALLEAEVHCHGDRPCCYAPSGTYVTLLQPPIAPARVQLAASPTSVFLSALLCLSSHLRALSRDE